MYDAIPMRCGVHYVEGGYGFIIELSCLQVNSIGKVWLDYMILEVGFFFNGAQREREREREREKDRQGTRVYS